MDPMRAGRGSPAPHDDTVTRNATREVVLNGLALAPAAANVVMQLSRLPIGHAVAKSRVTSGALRARPLKRTRTTLSYLLVALLGDEDERAWVRREVNRQHRGVFSLDGDEVAYDAFDPDLQLWVAACLYQGAVDAATLIDGPPSEATLDEIYRDCARFATTLQVPAQRWPEDRAAFARYWRSSLALVALDDLTRTYLRDVVSLSFAPRLVRRVLGPAHEFLTIGFLPEEFRRALGLAWSDEHQRRFEKVTRVIARVHRRLPRRVRAFPLNVIWWDTRRRFRRHRPLV
ncbi:MAG: DUF2236 domain-containing protein [Acidobacteriota bacterium]|nr:DUF2236 domain-containing protein [Acidobacteriota bacterium]MDE3044395.1 DUF2236 domain-containing protein [Acidobacteriota bacterium]